MGTTPQNPAEACPPGSPTLPDPYRRIIMISFHLRQAAPGGKIPPCVVFAWIGQPWSSCDNCGHHVDEHLYHPPYGDQKPIFHVKQYAQYLGWYWDPVGSLITPGRANADTE